MSAVDVTVLETPQLPLEPFTVLLTEQLGLLKVAHNVVSVNAYFNAQRHTYMHVASPAHNLAL